jgi:hypothetical protein
VEGRNVTEKSEGKEENTEGSGRRNEMTTGETNDAHEEK